MSTIQKTIDVAVPVRTAYDQWTQFESFPRFMEGVESVTQLDAKRLHWKAEIAGVTREWDAEIVDQTPDERVTWRAVDGTTNAGTVSFAPDERGRATTITLEMDYEPEGLVEKAGDMLNIVERRVEGDLKRFKEFIESRGAETGAWRGDVSPTGSVDPTAGTPGTPTDPTTAGAADPTVGAGDPAAGSAVDPTSGARRAHRI